MDWEDDSRASADLGRFTKRNPAEGSFRVGILLKSQLVIADRAAH
jgi:hypothetical protein